MASTEKRCLYEVLGVSREATADEIRSAYRRLALQRHPDKLVLSGVSEAEATASFQELVNAYEVLSDPKERAWYDSHRNQILFSAASSSGGSGSSSGFVPDLFGYFSNSVYSGYSDKVKGFYKVYGDLFEKIYGNELNFARKLGLPLPKEAPVMGNLESPYTQVTAFYNYWLGFATVLDFFWADQYDVMAGPNRKSRRLMEDENKKLRKKAKREYNETVRGLTEFVKKRDKRVIDMQMKRNEEMERKREEEKKKKKELERQKAERAKNYEEPDWVKAEEIEDDEYEEDAVEEKKNEFYCVVCSKKFKSEKQWKNHEQSKKHKEKVADLRDAFSEEDREFVAMEENEVDAEEERNVDGDDSIGYLSADDGVNELQHQFEGSVRIEKGYGDDDDAKTESSEADESEDINNYNREENTSAALGSDEDETGMLEAMLSGHKKRNKVRNRNKVPADKIQAEIDSNEPEFTEYNDTKGPRRNKGGRRRNKGIQEKEAETMNVKLAEIEEQDKDKVDDMESNCHPLPESEIISGAHDDSTVLEAQNHQRHAVNKKKKTKKENVSKPKTVSSRGRKQKVETENICEKCGEEFESRNKLHKHLGETGHASLKFR